MLKITLEAIRNPTVERGRGYGQRGRGVKLTAQAGDHVWYVKEIMDNFCKDPEVLQGSVARIPPILHTCATA